MSKIKVDEIESSSASLKLAGKGTGLVKVKGAGGADGTLQLTSGSNGVKLKSPPHSSAQSYTMILPDNNIVQNAFIKVKSVSGTGASAIAQLEYATQTEPDLTNLNASNFTTGTIATARLDTSSMFTASNGFGLKLISKSSVSVDNTISEISFTNLDADSMYWLLGKNVKCSNVSTNNLRINYLNSSNSKLSASGLEYRDAPTSGSYTTKVSNSSGNNYNLSGYYQAQKHGFLGEFSTHDSSYSFFETLSYSTSEPSVVNRFKTYTTSGAIRGITIKFNDTQYYFQSGTEILLYKMET